MTTESLGDQLHKAIATAKNDIFNQGELAQLAYGAFDIAVAAMHDSGKEEWEITFPVGYNADKTPINSIRKYTQSDLLARYQYLAGPQLSANVLMQLVTIVESALSDVVRQIVVRYPAKIGSKRQIPVKLVLESVSLEDVHIRATDALLNELSYKSPNEFAESVTELISINLLECPAFHRYLEIKATRDIHAHNRGMANDVYCRKAGSHARVKPGQYLPVNTQYFLESYESCIQVLEWLDDRVHEHWHSSLKEAENVSPSQPSLPGMTS